MMPSSPLELALERRADWTRLPAWSILGPVEEIGYPTLPLLSVYREFGVVAKDARDDNFNQAGQDLAVYQRVLPGDVVVNKMKAWQGSLGVSSLTGLVSPDYEVLRLRRANVDPHFLHFLLRSPPYVSEYRRRAYGIRPAQWRLMWDEFRTIPVVLPPPATQRAIAESLLAKTVELERLVEQKQHSLDLLRCCSLALVCGLDAKGQTQFHTHMEWLGRIPKSWSVERARFLFRQLRLEPSLGDGVVTAFRDGQVVLREERRSEGFTMAVQELGYQRVRAGDLVVHSMDAFAGAVGVSESTGKCSPEYLVLEPVRAGLHSRYFAQCLRKMAAQGFILVACPSVRERAPRLRFSTLREFWFPVPPQSEQLAIVDALGHIDESTRLIRKQIAMLRAFRDALLSNILWGGNLGSVQGGA